MYASNWELSAARAGAVVHYLLEDDASHAHRIEPWKITASGKAEYHPSGVADSQMTTAIQANPRHGSNFRYVVKANETLELQRKNRRIDLLLQYVGDGANNSK